MNTEFIKGVIVPIITVINEDEKIDEAGMRDQVDYVIEGGLDGILAYGSNGEFYQIEEDEMERDYGRPGCRPCPCLLWHWCHQYKEVRSSGKNGSS